MIEDLKLKVELKKFNLNNRTELYGESSLQVADALLELAIAIYEDNIIDGIFQKRDEKYAQYLEKALQIFRKNIDGNDIKIQRTLYYLSKQNESEMEMKYLAEARVTAENGNKPNMLPLIFIDYAMKEKKDKKHSNSYSISPKNANDIILKLDDIEDLSALSVFELMSYYSQKGLLLFMTGNNEKRKKGLYIVEQALDLSSKNYGTNNINYAIQLQLNAILNELLVSETAEIRQDKRQKSKSYFEKSICIFENSPTETSKECHIISLVRLAEIEGGLKNKVSQKVHLYRALALAREYYKPTQIEYKKIEWQIKEIESPFLVSNYYRLLRISSGNLILFVVFAAISGILLTFVPLIVAIIISYLLYRLLFRGVKSLFSQ